MTYRSLMHFWLLVIMLPSIAGCSIGHQYGYDQTQLTIFPTDWPPPHASSSYKIPEEVFEKATTVGMAMKIIATALEKAGYTNVSYFATNDGGVALVTQLERFGDDGAILPEKERWSAGQDSAKDLLRAIHNMYVTERGHYRVFVFVLGAAVPANGSPRILTRDEASTWLAKGVPATLPVEVAERPLGKAYCTVLLYEFEGTGTAVKLQASAGLPVALQLQKSGVLASLRQAARTF